MPCSDLSMVNSLLVIRDMRWSLAFEAWGESLTSSDEAWYCEQQKMKRKHYIKVLSHTKTDKDPQFIYFAPGSCQTQSYTWRPGGRELLLRDLQLHSYQQNINREGFINRKFLFIWALRKGLTNTWEIVVYMMLLAVRRSDGGWVITWPGYWPLIGWEWSHDQDTGLWLAESDHITRMLASDWLMMGVRC